MRESLRKVFLALFRSTSTRDEAQGLLSAKDSILLLLAENRGVLEESNADIARRLDMDPSNLKRSLDDLKREDLIRPIANEGSEIPLVVEGYEITEKGWQRLEPLTFVSTLLFGAFGGLLAAIFVIGYAYDFLNIPILHLGLETAAITSVILLSWLYRRERINRSLIVRRRRRSSKSQS